MELLGRLSCIIKKNLTFSTDWKEEMKLREVYQESIRQKFYSMCLLLEFLILEKEVLTWDDLDSELDLYFKPNNRPRMTKLLKEYAEREN